MEGPTRWLDYGDKDGDVAGDVASDVAADVVLEIEWKSVWALQEMHRIYNPSRIQQSI